MRPLPGFNLHRPTSLGEALELMGALKSVKPIAGGTDLLPLMRDRAITVEDIVDIRGLHELKGITVEDGTLRIGALTTLTEVLESPLVAEKASVLREAVGHIGSVQTRNQGTLAGNICNASPAADSAPALMVIGAQARVSSARGVRRVPVEELFAGPKMNSLGKDELVTEILIPELPSGSGAAFEKLGRRRGITLAVVNAAAYLAMDGKKCVDARIALGAIAATPIRLPEVEAAYKGRELTPEAIEESSRACYSLVNPVDDVRASADYRREMACVLVKRAIVKAHARAGGGQ
ncbi:xanthine dehydrogenase family protein subunit M [Candidatus Bathyarchaeota archaeon]|nr:xanthine dehydrogenase family protein subunit M [Candidatus Bathyarchaeota archaeon]